jgi:hypothetical protein
MLQFDDIVGAVHGLSNEEKVKLRLLLDEELEATESPATFAPPATVATKPRSGLIGLFADEPELMDRVMEAVYEHRARPLRIDD